MLRLDTFFPAPASQATAAPNASGPSGMPTAAAVAASRSLLTGPPSAGMTSLLFQHALNRAHHGASTLYVACGSDAAERLRLSPPIRPRLTAAAVCTAAEEEEVALLLRHVHVKYCATWPALRDVLVSLHLPETMPSHTDRLPDGIIIDDLAALFAVGRGDAASGAVSHSPVATPSPSRPEQKRVAMMMAASLALAAHAVDYLDHRPQPPRRPRLDDVRQPAGSHGALEGAELR